MTGLTATGAKNTLIAVIHQRIQIAVGLNQYRATGTAVTAIGAAVFNRLLATEADAAIAALAGVYFNDCFIYELHFCFRRTMQ